MRLLIIVSVLVVLFASWMLLVVTDAPTSGASKTEPVKVIENYSRLDVTFCAVDDCYHTFASVINSSRKSIHCALFDMDEGPLSDLFKNLANRVDVRVVMDGDNVLDLENVRSDSRSAYMHNKFCIVDGTTVMTGSMNPTKNGMFVNDNNLVVIESQYLADNYEDEFRELWSGTYGAGSSVRFPVISYGNVTIENFFCPEDDCKQHLINVLNNAKESIYFMTFSFTDDDVGNLLSTKAGEGVHVEGVFETRSISRYSEYYLLNESTSVYKDHNPRSMHHKVFVIDNTTVVSGSFNPTRNGAIANDENVLIIRDPIVARKYLKEYFRVRDGKVANNSDQHNDVVISEVIFNPSGTDDGNEYVTIVNMGLDVAYLYGYVLSSKEQTLFLNGSLVPRAKLNISISPLTNKGDRVKLKHGPFTEEVSWGEGGMIKQTDGMAVKKYNLTVVNDAINLYLV